MKLNNKQITEVFRTAKALRRQKLTYYRVARMLNDAGYTTKYGHSFTDSGAWHLLHTVKYTEHLRGN
jgi:hypothetical protein